LKLNKKQLASLAKYLYDISKGILIACMVASVTATGIMTVIIIGVIQAMIFLLSALLLEKEVRDE